MEYANPFGIKRDMIVKIVSETSKRMQEAKRQVFQKYDIHMSNKNISEILSKVMEKVASDVFTERFGFEVKKAGSDREPDLTFIKTGRMVEIKVTSTANVWTGGEFSKRPLEYLLVSWGGDFDEFFVAFTHLKKSDWTSRFQNNYYGPSFDIKKLHKKKDKEIFLGKLTISDNGNIKMIREKV